MNKDQDETPPDIDILKNYMEQQLEEEIKCDKQRYKDRVQLANLDSSVSGQTNNSNIFDAHGNLADNLQQKMPQVEFEIQERNLFYENIAKRTQIYDPLDRDILNNEGNVQNISTQNLKDLILSETRTPKIGNTLSTKLNVPLNT